MFTHCQPINRKWSPCSRMRRSRSHRDLSNGAPMPAPPGLRGPRLFLVSLPPRRLPMTPQAGREASRGWRNRCTIAAIPHLIPQHMHANYYLSRTTLHGGPSSTSGHSNSPSCRPTKQNHSIPHGFGCSRSSTVFSLSWDEDGLRFCTDEIFGDISCIDGIIWTHLY